MAKKFGVMTHINSLHLIGEQIFKKYEMSTADMLKKVFKISKFQQRFDRLPRTPLLSHTRGCTFKAGG